MVDLILLLPGASVFVGAMTKQPRVPPVLPLNHFVLFVESSHRRVHCYAVPLVPPHSH
jgi:hypothetical protein